MYLLKTFVVRMYDFEDELDILVNDFIKENNVVDFHVVSEWIDNDGYYKYFIIKYITEDNYIKSLERRINND